MANRKLRTPEKLIDASDHIAYEWRMLNKCAERLDPFNMLDQVIHDALLDDFLIHARNLKAFFDPPKDPRDDAVIVDDYLPNPAEKEKIKRLISNTLKVNYEPMHKYLAHISYDRGKITDKKEWPCPEIRDDLNVLMQCFIETVDKAKVCTSLHD